MPCFVRRMNCSEKGKQMTMRRFTSPGELLSATADLFRGPTFLMTFRRVDRVLREKILIAITAANNCYL